MGKRGGVPAFQTTTHKTDDMKHLAAIITLTLCTALPAAAQTFLDRLQKSGNGQGTVTVTQSEEINDLVNGNKTATATERAGTAKAVRTQPAKQATPQPGHKPAATGRDGRQEPIRAEKPRTGAEQDNVQDSQPYVDTHKKVMRKSYKVNGYRVQVFAGGNTRNDRKKAERIGNDIKANFPSEPVYVHFYSPRWICRVGNYRTYEEAYAMLRAVKEAGYRQAAIVKGKISVQY